MSEMGTWSADGEYTYSPREAAMWAAALAETKQCPNCGRPASRDEVDVAVGWVFGPWGCSCGWSEDDDFNQLDGPKRTDEGLATDPWGGGYPEGHPDAWAIGKDKP